MFSRKLHQSIFVFGSALLAISLPVSFFLLSVSIILLCINWAFEGRFKEKFEILKSRKSLLLLVSIYFLHIIWLINTTDFSYALHDIRIKLPLLLLPLVYGTSRSFTRLEYKFILLVFAGTVMVSSWITSYVIFGFSRLDPVDSRYASLFISHIRFSLMVVLSIYILSYMIFTRKLPGKPFEKYVYAICILWLICFLVILQSFTGVIIFCLLLPVTIIWGAHALHKPILILISYLLCFLILSGITAYFISSVKRFNLKNEIDLTNLESHTVNGNKYDHYLDQEEYENGQRIWLYIAETELEKAWNNVSIYKYDSLDRKNQTVRYTLVRYMSSMGLRKDSIGFAQLQPEDIRMIEKGYTNHLYKKKFALYPRIYEFLWEIDNYQKTGDPSGQSLGQRIEYLKVGKNIVKRFFWFGTGTGDVKAEFRKQYEIDHSLLKPEWQHRAHNQFLTFMISFGLFGLIWLVFALVTPVIIEGKYTHFLLVIFLLISILSMLNEDTLETHVGVSFFAFFYSFFLFASPENSHTNEETS